MRTNETLRTRLTRRTPVEVRSAWMLAAAREEMAPFPLIGKGDEEPSEWERIVIERRMAGGLPDDEIYEQSTNLGDQNA